MHLKVNCKRFYKLLSYERAFKMLKNDMCITEIGQAVLEYLMGRESSLKLENVVFRFLEFPITAENDVIVQQ